MGPGVSRLFQGIFEAHRKGLSGLFEWAQPVPTFAVVIPFAFTVAWIVLLIFASSRKHWWLSGSVGAVAIIVSTIVAARLCRGPIMRKEHVASIENDKVGVPDGI